MNLKLIIRLAKSLLLARWKQTLVAAIGVTFSIAMFIALLGFMTGLNGLLDGLILNRTPHIRLYNEIKPNPVQPINQVDNFKSHYNFIRSVKSGNSRESIYNSAAILETLSNDERVLGYSPKLTTQVFFNEGVIDITGVVNGIDVVEESRLFHFNDYTISGLSTDLVKVNNSIILGKGLADKLIVDVGDMVQVTPVSGERFSLKVVGLYQSGLQDYDNVQSFATVSTVQKLLGKSSGYITDIQIKLKDIDSAPLVGKEYAAIFQTDALDIQTANAQFETGSFIRTLISYVVGITLLIVSGFGIFNILNMMIYEKMDAIAILKATGFSGLDVNRIFMVIAVSIGLFGGVVGLVMGFGISNIIDQVPFRTEALPTIKTYPINYNPVFYLIGVVFALVTTFLAGWFPARKASKVDPVIIIRGK